METKLETMQQSFLQRDTTHKKASARKWTDNGDSGLGTLPTLVWDGFPQNSMPGPGNTTNTTQRVLCEAVQSLVSVSTACTSNVINAWPSRTTKTASEDPHFTTVKWDKVAQCEAVTTQHIITVQMANHQDYDW